MRQRCRSTRRPPRRSLTWRARDALSYVVHDGAGQFDVRRAPNELQRQKIDSHVEREPKIVTVLGREGRCAKSDTRQIQALVVADVPALHDSATNLGAVDA